MLAFDIVKYSWYFIYKSKKLCYFLKQMNLLKRTNIESIIVYLLQSGEKKTTDLLAETRTLRRHTTKQGFYAAVRKMKREEVVVIYKKKVALHTTWIKEMQEAVEHLSQNYMHESNSFDALSLADGEHASYSFSNLNHLDIFWGHSQNILSRKSPTEPIYAYDPHYWFYIARQESEKKLLKSLVKHKQQFLIAVGGKTPLDKHVKTEFNNKYVQCNLENIFTRPNYYITIIGEYITEVFLDQSVSKKIDHLYQKHTVLSPELISELKTLLSIKSKNRIKITRNKSKANILKKKMGANFYVIR